MVYDYVLGFHVSMHDPLTVRVVKSFKNLVHIIPDVHIGQLRYDLPEVLIEQILENKTRCFTSRVFDNI